MARNRERSLQALTGALRSRVLGIVCALILPACHQVSPSTAPQQPSATATSPRAPSSPYQAVTPTGVQIGDKDTFGAMIVELKPYPRTNGRLPAFKTSYTLKEPAYLIWLEVIPGRSMALLYPTSGSSMAMAQSGVHSIDFHYQAVAGAAASVENKAEQAKDEYFKCVDDAERAAEAALRRQQASQPKPPPKRDKDGRIIPEPANPPADVAIDMNTRRMIEQRCRQQHSTPSGGSGEVVQAERYLVVLASYVPMSASLLNARLDALEVTASSVKGTIENIAQGIYLDPHAVWAGHYIPW